MGHPTLFGGETGAKGKNRGGPLYCWIHDKEVNSGLTDIIV